ncbi:MAG: helix-turn-helix transcriptional regulator [Ruminococcus sp.]|nr:helix-turn-helix transcriptional regulator [Ruminococcus sp.]
MTFGEKIRNAREDMDLLQSDMARLIPMNQSNYSKIERDIQEPNLEQMRRICVILKLDPRYLLDITETDMITDKDLRLLKDARELIEKYR